MEYISKWDIAYTAVEALDSSLGQHWIDFINWSEIDLSHLKEVISIDQMLCPSVVGELMEELRYQVLLGKHILDLFINLDYVLSRIVTDKKFVVIAAMHEPALGLVEGFKDERFIFKGYDLMDDGSISALTNCGGGFNLAYSRDDISESGLVVDSQRVFEIKDNLKKYYPYDNHADCTVWALWKMREEYLPVPKMK